VADLARITRDEWRGEIRAEPLIVVVGPTAAGKSDLAIRLARRFGAEVVSADAFQVYRGFDIGTAKVDAAAAGVAHHCVDVAEPGERFTAGRYARTAAAAIESIRSRGRRVVVAGGTGFYIRALIEGLAPLPGSDRRWRRALRALEERRGLEHLYGMLAELDPRWAEAVGPTDPQRIQRGLEVTLRCGEPMSRVLAREERSGPRYEAVWVGLTWPRSMLHERIETRVDAMLSSGWLGEIESLRAAGVAASAPAMRAIGYRQLAACLDGELTLEEAREQIVRVTRRYAKRQLTWFRGQAPVRWFERRAADPADRQRVDEAVEAHLGATLPCKC
jgi:tRNA dimethylallyltransferase